MEQMHFTWDWLVHWRNDGVRNIALALLATMLISLPVKATADLLYEDASGRFTLPLLGDWAKMDESDGYVRFEYAELPLSLSIITVDTLDYERAVETALQTLGFDMGDLTEKSRGQWNKWNMVFYVASDGRGLNILGQADATYTYLIIGMGDEDLAANPPEDVFGTIESFSLTGETVLPTTVEGFEQYVARQIGGTTPGLAVVVATGSGVMYAKGFGVADGPRGVAAESGSVFRWGSTTKAVTATAILQLHEKGLLDLDMPVSEYLDYFSAEYPITVRHLLTHSSGLPEASDFVMKTLRLPGQPLPDFDKLDRAYYENLTGLMFEPGRISAYVNPDYLTLGQIVAAISGQDYVDYVREHILSPLGMDNTDFVLSNDYMAANVVTPAIPEGNMASIIAMMDAARGLGDGADFFRETSDGLAWLNPYIVGESAGGGLMGPPTELVRFGQMILNGGEVDGVPVLSEESVRLFQEVQLSNSGAPLGIGLAWFHGGDEEHPFIEHDGGGAGLQTKLRIYPEDGIAIAIMANGAGFDRAEMADAAANVVFALFENPGDLPSWMPTALVTGLSGETITFKNKDITLAGTLDLPAGDGPFPAIVTVHGSAPVNRNDYYLLKYSDFFVQHGFAVLRYDKRGATIGESTGQYVRVGSVSDDPEMAEKEDRKNLTLLADDAIAGIEYLKTIDVIDPEKIGVMGLSQAGWIVLLAAERSDDVAFFVALSGTTASLGQEMYYSDLAGDIGRIAQMSEREASDAAEIYDGVQGYDPMTTLINLDTPGFWALGGRDKSIPVYLTLKDLDALRRDGKDFEYVFYPNANHGLRDEDTGAIYPFLLDALNWYETKFGQ